MTRDFLENFMRASPKIEVLLSLKTNLNVHLVPARKSLKTQYRYVRLTIRRCRSKRGLLRAAVKTKESQAPSAAYWHATSAGGGFERTYGRKQKNVRGDRGDRRRGDRGDRGENNLTYTGVQM